MGWGTSPWARAAPWALSDTGDTPAVSYLINGGPHFVRAKTKFSYLKETKFEMFNCLNFNPIPDQFNISSGRVQDVCDERR